MKVELSPKQELSIRQSSGRVNIWSGAIRSGKTIGSLVRWLLFVANAPSSGQLVMVGRTRDAVWRNVIASLQDETLFGPVARLVVGNHGSPVVTILGRRVHVLGAHDAKSEKSIRGMTVAGAYVDEVTTLSLEFFTQLLGRMSVRGAKLFGTTNPDSPAHWLKVRFLDRLDELPDWRHWAFELDDNPALTDDYVRSIKAEFTGLFYRRFVLGEWVAADGAVYDSWDEELHAVEHDDLPDMVQVLSAGIDYGTTNATACLPLGIGSDGVLYLLDEWRYEPSTKERRWTDEQLSAGIREFLPSGFGHGWPEPTWKAVDPAAASFKVQLSSDGVTRVMNANNDVLYGIKLMSSLLASGRLKVSKRCVGFIREVVAYSWDTAASEKGEDKPVKVADHSLDAARYAVASTETIWRKYLREQAKKGAKDAA